MEYQAKVAWLRRYQEARRMQLVLAEELEQLRTDALRITPALTGMPGGTPDGQSLPRAVERIVQAQQELQAQINLCGGIRRDIVAVINQVGDARDREILRRRYLLGQTWNEIAEAMPMDERNVRRRHHKAVLKIALFCPV